MRVASDGLISEGLLQTEAEQKAMEAAALAEFASQMGMAAPMVDASAYEAAVSLDSDPLAEFVATQKIGA